MTAPKIAIVIYSQHGHIAKLAEAVKKGVESAGGKVDIYQIAETLSDEVLRKILHLKEGEKLPPPRYPIFTPEELRNFDAYLFGVPTRYGNMPAQWKTFWDATGKLWVEGAVAGKYAGLFTSTGTLGGGQEMTILNNLSTLSHLGFIYVPLGYKYTFQQASNLTEVHGSSPWGAGTFAGADGKRVPTELELEIARIQGETFYETVSKVKF